MLEKQWVERERDIVEKQLKIQISYLSLAKIWFVEQDHCKKSEEKLMAKFGGKWVWIIQLIGLVGTDLS